MTDKELLEQAAKAAGLVTDDEYREIGGLPAFWIDEPQSHWWMPLTDDLDAFRLMVKLGLLVDVGCSHRGFVSVRTNSSNWIEVREKHNNEPKKATRRAIVRAASEIGRTL